MASERIDAGFDSAASAHDMAVTARWLRSAADFIELGDFPEELFGDVVSRGEMIRTFHDVARTLESLLGDPVIGYFISLRASQVGDVWDGARSAPKQESAPSSR